MKHLLKFVETSQKNDIVWDWVRERKRLSGQLTANRSWGESLNKKVRYGLLRTVCFSLQLFYLCLLKNVNRWIERRAALNEDARKVAREKWSKSKTFLFTVAILPFFCQYIFTVIYVELGKALVIWWVLWIFWEADWTSARVNEGCGWADFHHFSLPWAMQASAFYSFYNNAQPADLACVEQPL